jgi:hypothetical protein
MGTLVVVGLRVLEFLERCWFNPILTTGGFQDCVAAGGL